MLFIQQAFACPAVFLDGKEKRGRPSVRPSVRPSARPSASIAIAPKQASLASILTQQAASQHRRELQSRKRHNNTINKKNGNKSIEEVNTNG